MRIVKGKEETRVKRNILIYATDAEWEKIIKGLENKRTSPDGKIRVGDIGRQALLSFVEN